MSELERALAGDLELAFVTAGSAWPEGEPGRVSVCRAADLLGRPLLRWPTVFRDEPALGNRDASLGELAELELCLRALASGKRGLVLDAPPLHPAAAAPPGALAQIVARHRALVEAELPDVLAAKERWLRAISRQAAERHRLRAIRRAELAALDERAARLEAALERLR
jgi:hypothetical protein